MSNVDEATLLKATSSGSIEGEKRPLELVKWKGELQMYFLNWLLMYLAGNYCYRISAIVPPGANNP